MNVDVSQKTLSRLFAVGAAGVTIFLLTGNVTDPVNAPKLFLLGGLAGATSSLLVYLISNKNFRVTGLEVLVVGFILWGFLSLMASESPFSQGIYGVYGRNTGFLTYAFLGVIAIAATQLLHRSLFKLILIGFLVSLAVNVAYGLWVLFFGDFLGWQNNYGALLGTFGNPNFISSFLGMGFSLVLALTIKSNTRLRIGLLLALPLIAVQLHESKSLQGIIVAVLGVWVVTFFWIRSKTQSESWSIAYLSSGALIAGVSIAGALGAGPLKQALSQPTIALREQYWLAALNMANSHPFLGVGMDSYGDWYRRARSPEALITPGREIVTNTAHNVFLDIASYGGYPLLALYVLITALGAYSILYTAKQSKSYDPVFVGITVLWLGFQAQSLISINQIGLAVWGWLINGLVIAYRLNRFKEIRPKLEFGPSSARAKNSKPEIFSPQLIASVGGVLGLLLAVPPLSADITWREVQLSGQVSKVEPALQGGYLKPLNSHRLAEAVQILETSKLPEYAIKYARLGVIFNPQNFDAWRMLYFASSSTVAEKEKAKKQMVSLDPLNPSWKELK
jgi:hypothetical protein